MKKMILLVLLSFATLFSQVWKSQQIGSASGISQVTSLNDGYCLVAAGNNGDIYANEFLTGWKLIRTGQTGEEFTGITKASETTFFAYGKNGFLVKGVRLSNGNWSTNTVLLNYSYNLWDMVFADGKGYIISDSSVVYKSWDNGENWGFYVFPSWYKLSCISVMSNKVLLGRFSGEVSPNQQVIVTDTNFVSLLFCSTHSIMNGVSAVKLINSTTAYATGGAGTMRSTDGGVNWVMLTEGFQNFGYGADIISSGSSTIAVSTYYGLFYLTTNGGSTWTKSIMFPSTTPYTFKGHLTSGGTYYYGALVPGSSGDANVFKRVLEPIVELQSASGFVNDTIKVPVYLVRTNSDENLYSFEARVSGYAAKLQFIGIKQDNSSLFTSWGWGSVANAVNDTIRIAGYGSGYLNSYSGKLFDLLFLAPSSIQGYKDSLGLTLDTAHFNTNDTPPQLRNTTVYIKRAFPGDVDLNGIVQAFDASMILRHIVGSVTLNDDQKRNAEVTNDTSITSLDASNIARYIVGLIPSLPWTPTNRATGAPVMIDITAAPGQEFTVPVYLNNSTGTLSFEGKLVFDASKFNFVSFAFTEGFAGKFSEANGALGSISFALAAIQARDIPITEAIAKLKLQVKPEISLGTQTEILLSSFRVNQNPLLLSGARSVVHILTDVEDERIAPKEFGLQQNFPNPFNPSTKISFSLPTKSMVALTVYDISGKQVAELLNEEKSAGTHSVTFDATGLPSGSYVYRITTGFGSVSRKMLLLK